MVENGLIALIPARGGSKRIPGKNIKPLCGHPVIAYTIDAAIKAKIFEAIYVSSDSNDIGCIAERYGATWIRRPPELSGDMSPDVEWIVHALSHVSCETFMILRPTNPFRTDETINHAWDRWDRIHPLKAIQLVSEHPGKMWKMVEDWRFDHSGGAYDAAANSMLMEHIRWTHNVHEHLLPTQQLGKVYIQNACIEIRPRALADGQHYAYQAFITKGYEGFDLNSEDDWILAEALLERGIVKLPEIGKETYGSSIQDADHDPDGTMEM